MSNFTPRTGEYSPKSLHSYKTFTTYSWNHYAPETAGNCTWFAFGETSRIVQECKNDESYNIQYSSGNEFMTYGPNALLWISNAHTKGAWSTEGDVRGNYNPSSSSLAGTQINVQEGDILCYWASDGFGHVEIVERINGGYVYCSGSKAAAQQPAVFYYTRTVVLSQFKVGTRHYFSGLDAQGNTISWSNDYFQGVIHNPYVTGTTPTEVPQVTISPTYYNKTMSGSETYVDFTYSITVTGIPDGYSASGNTTYTGLTRISNGSGWQYTNYTIGGVTYRQATKTGMILRYTREHDYAYTTTKYLTYSCSYSTGSASASSRMNITVNARSSGTPPSWLFGNKKKKRFTIFRI